MSKVPKYKKTKQINFEKVLEEIQTRIGQFIERISNNNDIYKNHFSLWIGHLVKKISRWNQYKSYLCK